MKRNQLEMGIKSAARIVGTSFPVAASFAQLSSEMESAEQMKAIVDIQKAMERHKQEDEGFALATQEYSYRTREIGFCEHPRCFKSLGYCCHIDERRVITSKVVLDWIADATCGNGFYPAVFDRYFDPDRIESVEPCIFNELSIVTLAETEKDYSWAENADNKDIGQAMLRDAKHQISVRQKPLKMAEWASVGEEVAFVGYPRETEEERLVCSVVFDTAYVSFLRNIKNGAPGFVLTPSAKIEHRGCPVFRSDSTLIGLVTDVLVTNDIEVRPVVASAIAAIRHMKREEI